jgi:WD40 repeat protein
MKRHLLLLAVASFAFAGLAYAQAPTELKGHTALVSSLAFNKDGNVLASGSYDGTIRLWEYPSGKPLQTIKAGDKQIYTIAYTPDGTSLASGDFGGMIKLWNPKDVAKAAKEFKGHNGAVTSIAYGPDNATLASGGVDKSVRLWDTKAAKELKNLGAHKESVYAVAFSPDGQYVVSGSYDGAIKLWDVKGQKEIKEFLAEPLKVVFVETKKPEEKKKEEKKEEKKVEKKKDEKKKEMAKKKDEPKEIRDGVLGLAFTPDSKMVMAVGFDKTLRVWDISTGKETRQLGPTHDALFGITVSRDGKNVATGGYGGSLRVWEIGSWKPVASGELRKPDRPAVVHSITFTPDGKALVTGQERPDNVISITPLGALKAGPAPKK